MHGEFLGKSERGYTGRDGQGRTARNVSLLLDTGEVGQMFCSERAFATAANLKRGDRVRVVGELAVYNGKVELRPAGFEVVKGA